MTLRCIDALTGQSLHAFEFDPMEWDNLASRNKREGHLRTPCCQADVILRRSKLGSQHFVHRVRGACNSTPETEEHRQVKRVIVEVGRANGWLADAEVDGLSPEGEAWRADVLLSKARLASPLTSNGQSKARMRQCAVRLVTPHRGSGGFGYSGSSVLRHPKTFLPFGSAGRLPMALKYTCQPERASRFCRWRRSYQPF